MAARPPALSLLEDCHDGTFRATSDRIGVGIPPAIAFETCASLPVRRSRPRCFGGCLLPGSASLPANLLVANALCGRMNGCKRCTVASAGFGPPCPARRLEGDADLLVTSASTHSLQLLSQVVPARRPVILAAMAGATVSPWLVASTLIVRRTSGDSASLRKGPSPGSDSRRVLDSAALQRALRANP